MSINSDHFRLYIVRPVITYLGLYSAAAEELLMLTAAHESNLGYWVTQQNDGPARGPYQMEIATHNDLWQSYLIYSATTATKVRHFSSNYLYCHADQMRSNFAYATACARVQYYRAKPPLPKPDDIQGLAEYWHEHWCKGCAGTVQEAMYDYKTFVKGKS